MHIIVYLQDGDPRRPLPHSVTLSALPLKQFTLVQAQVVGDSRSLNAVASTAALSTPTVASRAAPRLAVPSTRALPIVPPLSLATEHSGNPPPRGIATTPSAGLSIRVFASTPVAGVTDSTFHAASMSSVAPAPYTLQERVLTYSSLDIKPILIASHELFVRLQRHNASCPPLRPALHRALRRCTTQPQHKRQNRPILLCPRPHW